jgi:hypothetical protein
MDTVNDDILPFSTISDAGTLAVIVLASALGVTYLLSLSPPPIVPLAILLHD